MIGQNAKVKHVWVSKHYPGFFSYASPLSLGCVAIKGSHSVWEKKLGEILRFAQDLFQAAQLILGQSFSGENIKSTASLIIQDCLKRGQVIAQGLATGTRCGYYHVPPGKDSIQRLRLMPVQMRYAQGFQARL